MSDVEESGADETKKSEDQSDVDEFGGDETKESVDQTTESGSDECRGDETNTYPSRHDYQGLLISYFERNHTLRNSVMFAFTGACRFRFHLHQ